MKEFNGNARRIYHRVPSFLVIQVQVICRVRVAVMLTKHQVGGDERTRVTLDEQATEFVLG
jgi:hypothetical protein